MYLKYYSPKDKLSVYELATSNTNTWTLGFFYTGVKVDIEALIFIYTKKNLPDVYFKIKHWSVI